MTTIPELLRDAPRRFRMPALPPGIEQARSASCETALAYAMETMRLAQLRGETPGEDLRELFTQSLAALIRSALATGSPDPSFRALVLKDASAAVREYLRLVQSRRADEREVRTAIDRIAHPARRIGHPDESRLARVHALRLAGDWQALAREPLELADAARSSLARLMQGDTLAADTDVLRYKALLQEQGPLAGSADAEALGRAAGRTGADAEEHTVRAFREIARLLDADSPGHGVARGLRAPPGFPGNTHKAKDEWDVALLHRAVEADAFSIVLLAEVKASPASATADFARLHRGLARLAQADADVVYTFTSSDGAVPIAGHSLRRLEPQGRMLPPHVIYCSTLDAEGPVALLGAPARAVLLAEAASIEFAQQLLEGRDPAAHALDAVWHDLAHVPRLRSALNQYDTSRAARDAMFHPDDLLASLRSGLGLR